MSRIEVSNAEGNGKVCIDAKRVTELLKAMPDCPVSFDINDNSLAIVIRYTNGKYNLSGLPGVDYPLSDDIDAAEILGSFNIPSSQILSAFDRVGFAIANDELRPQFNGILWDVKEEAITFVATDTRALAKYRSTQVAPGTEMQIILPGRSISLLRAFIGKQADIKLSASNRAVVFEGNDFKVRAVLLNGRYPDYNRVIPQDNPISVVVDRNDLTNAVTRVSICADSQMSLLRFKLSPGTLDVIAEDLSFNVGGEERIACDYNGNAMEIGFSASYLKGILNTLNTQKIVVKLSSPDRPGVFLPAENDEYGELTLLCMPMSISKS